MTRIVFISHEGARREVELVDGMSVMQGAMQNNVAGIVAECGGACSCATCHVYVDEADMDRVPAAFGVEEDMLDCVAAERRPTSRLCCQIRVTPALQDLVLHLPETQS